jgi:hypothetical protein
VITVQFELGPETRELIERLVARAAMELELGPKTRGVIEALVREEREPTR